MRKNPNNKKAAEIANRQINKYTYKINYSLLSNNQNNNENTINITSNNYNISNVENLEKININTDLTAYFNSM